jgi:Tfp pilus assembly protein PilF
VIREQRGDLAGAREAYLNALRFTRERPRLENNLAGLALREGRPDEAEQRLRSALAEEPGYALAWSNLGALYVNTGRLPQAAEALRRAAELQPDVARNWLQLAEVLERLGRAAEAEQARRRAGRP